MKFNLKKIKLKKKKELSFELNSSLLKKYDYNINEVIGFIEDEKYILYADKKLISFYNGDLHSKALLTTYIPIDAAIFYSFELKKSVLEKVELNEFIETKVYEEAGVDQTESYVIKYNVIDLLKDSKEVTIECVIIPESYLIEEYSPIIDKVGYIDYISFPSFSFRALYNEDLIPRSNDLFILLLEDKAFLAFYNNGDLVNISTISGGLNKIFERLQELNIRDFDKEVFKKLIRKKGINEEKYKKFEKSVLEELRSEFSSFINIINSQIEKITEKFTIDEIENIYITSEYGNIDKLDEYFQKNIAIKTQPFTFLDEYNIEKIQIDPFLFLSMLEAHSAYKFQDFDYNFSYELRKPTFLYRPSGRLILITLLSLVLFGIYPLILFINGLAYANKNDEYKYKIQKLTEKIGTLTSQIKQLKEDEKNIKEITQKYTQNINKTKLFIKKVYEFKYSYIPKSSELVDITTLLNANRVYLDSLKYEKGVFELKVFAFDDTSIPNLLESLVKRGFRVNMDGVKYMNNRYIATIRIYE